MTHIVRIDASALSQGSESKKLADFFCEQFMQNHPNTQLTQHILAQTLPSHIDEAFIGAAYTPAHARTEQQKERLSYSDQHVQALKRADVLLISTPMYNFSLPSTLKAWLDNVTRVGETFKYDANGPEGLLNIPKVIVIVSSGGDYTQAPLNKMNFVEPYLTTILGFIGLHNVTFVNAPGLAMGEESKTRALNNAQQALLNLI
ncbi:FMN-dependent NADH-azoreductase [Thiomicrorhabdus aquaedulcis]|uniref:FMN-dependent NADH-azoreductase n=1 Tax=Thiomicrorhabdus aquaedulcis TaxID=2211106 RepID=UPI000FDA3600|nr:NAD(P)H-dependent oxidoreductase [Thiomicrorhabdus aquaedulcis]